MENYQAPSPAIKTSNNFDNIIMNILMKCIIILSTSKNRKEKFFIFQSILYGEYGIAITYEKLMEFKGVYIQRQNDNYLAKNFLLFLEFLKNFEDKIKEDFVHKYNLIIRLEFTKEKNDNSTGSNIYNITCKYSFYNPIDNKPFIYKEENILINGINSNYQVFYFMLSDINNDIYTNIKYKEYHPENQTCKVKSKNENIKNNKDSTINISKNNNNKCENNENNQEILLNIIDESTKMQSYCNNSLFNSNSSKYNIINFINIIGEHENSADHIIELSDNYYLSGGCDNTLILYKQYLEVMKIKEINEWSYKVTEKITTNERENKNIELICSTNKELITLNIYKETFRPKIKKYQIPKKKITNCIQMKENNMVILGNGGASYYTDLFNNYGQLAEYKITEKTYRGGIRIDDKTVALTSNSILNNGEDKLIFYNTKSKKISNIIEGYSFNISINNLVLIPREEIKSNNKILFCACKRYNINKKNGILLINPNLGDNKSIKNEFYDTDNFEVYCFCPILKYENNLEINNKNKINKIDTEYFFVGGFDLEKREGKIKLFKIIYDEKVWLTKIKFIQDIEFDDNNPYFEEFDGPINCIIQSKTTGHILATCYNGKVYLFTPPNIEYYLKKNY